MWKVVAWLAFAVAVSVGLWQLTQDKPFLPHTATGLLLVAAALVVGIRIGYEAASRFVQDGIRMSNVVVEQNKDLTELNSQLLKWMLSGSPEPFVPKGSTDDTSEESD